MKLAKVVDPRNKEKDPVSTCALVDIITFFFTSYYEAVR